MTPKSNAPVPFRPEAGLPATDPAASQAMLDSLSDPFIWLDPEWRVRYLNPAAARCGAARRTGRPQRLGQLSRSGRLGLPRRLPRRRRHRQPAAHTGYYAPLASGSRRAPFRRVTASSWCCAMCRTCTPRSRSCATATHDYLTGLPNRRQLMDTLSGAIAEAAAGLGQRTLLAVLFLDLDRFKEVNDTFGHAEGDALLRERLRRFQTPSIFCAPAATSSRWYCATPPNAPPRRWPTPC